ncbi:MAG: putative membrane protein [halophilic archaeon J07HB67]|jgi:Predicted membrane protein|nr:MAG: putative membrane protein [halophilic archaeon J07HB67]
MSGLWTLTDKLVAALVVLLAAGYAVTPVRELVVGGLTGVLAPLSVWLPFSALVVGLGGLSGVTSAVARRVVRDADRAEQARERVAELRDRLADADDSELAETRDRLREETLTALAENLRPAVYSAVVTIPAFLWLRWVFTAPAAALAPATVLVPFVGPVAWTATLVGPVKLWLVWYLGASLSTGAVARRVVGRAGSATE